MHALLDQLPKLRTEKLRLQHTRSVTLFITPLYLYIANIVCCYINVRFFDSQETMMDHPLRTISYIADIGNIVVLMARRRMPRSDSQENVEASDPGQDSKRQYKMICHVFESEDVSPTAKLDHVFACQKGQVSQL